MPRVATIVPDEVDLLCEQCGYTLNGLPAGGNCPECGRPIASSLGEHRMPPDWERSARARLVPLLRTTMRVLFRPDCFYRTLATRTHSTRAEWFAVIYLTLSSVLLAAAALGHAIWFAGWWRYRPRPMAVLWFGLALVVLAFAALAGTAWLVMRLTGWEARYRGLRLPASVVRRGMHYHSVHLVPVALMGFATVFGYRWLLLHGWLGPLTLEYYLYTLGAEVILGAVYLFQTYWIAMRNMMYANR